MVELPNTMVDLLNTMVDLPNTMVDIPNTMVDLPKTMVDLYEYEILAFDRQVAGSSPTVGVWNPHQIKGVLQRALRAVVSIQVAPK